MLNKMCTPFPVLTTKRLALRQLVSNDAPVIFTLRSNSEINKYLDRQLSKTIEDATNFINAVNENIAKNNGLYWGITLSDKNILVGTICLFSFNDAAYTCEIGYELLTNYQGQGIMQEAAQKVIDYAFNTINVKKIAAFLHRDNQASVKLLQQLSFSKSNEADKGNPDLVCYDLIHAVLP